MQQESFFRKRGPVLFFAAFSVLLFWQYFLLDQTSYAGDMAFALLPLCRYAMERLASGELPLWNPHLIAGTPGLAEATHQTLYPPNVLLLLIGVPRGMGWLMPLHLFWMALGFYLFVRSALGMGRIAATFSTLSFSFGGLMLGGTSIPIYIYSSSWVPWALLAYEKARTGSWVAWAGICIAMQLLTGGASYAYYTLTLLLAYHLFRSYACQSVSPEELPQPQREVNTRAWWAMGLTAFIAVALSAAQLIPQAELALASERGTRASYEYVIYGSLVPHHFFTTFLFPAFYGLFDSPTREGFLPTAQLAYMGVSTLVCLFIGTLLSPQRRQVWFWAVLVVFSLTLAFGQYNPFYHFFYEWVPGIASFRWPTRWLIITVFAGAVLAGLGIEALQRMPFAPRRKYWTAIAVALFVGGGGSLFLLLVDAPDESKVVAWPQIAMVVLTLILLSMLPKQSKSKLTQIEGEDRVHHSESVLLQTRTRWVLLVLTGFLAFDLWWMAQSMELQHTLSVAALEEKPATAKFLTQQPTQERFWSLAEPMPLEAWQAGAMNIPPLEFRARSAAALREMMPSCMASEFGGLGLTGAWGALMPTQRNAHPLYVVDTPEAVKQRWLRLLNARYYISLRPAADMNLQTITHEAPFIYRDEQAMPRAFWVPQASRLDSKNIMKAISEGRLAGNNFDPSRMVLLENSSSAPVGKESPSASAEQVASQFPVELKEIRPEEIELRVNTTREGYVVLMDTPYPGWRVQINNAAGRWEPANWVGRNVRVPAGENRIKYYFEPQSVRVGFFISLLALFFLAFSWMLHSGKATERN